MHWSEAVRRLRIAWYRRLWTCAEVQGSPCLHAPAVLAGAGSIHFQSEVILGWKQSPGFLAGYSYIEARHPGSAVTFGERSHLNNGVTIINEGSGISIGRRCLIGPGVHIYDSDFHALEAGLRATALPRRASVEIDLGERVKSVFRGRPGTDVGQCQLHGEEHILWGGFATGLRALLH